MVIVIEFDIPDVIASLVVVTSGPLVGFPDVVCTPVDPLEPPPLALVV
ncbi:MAG: hypothetical protein JNL82_30650 [Myxococcales bacterium]|nr:hypothetical protein [Myxococcales bacterium]